jgi:hypothetical protein
MSSDANEKRTRARWRAHGGSAQLGLVTLLAAPCAALALVAAAWPAAAQASSVYGVKLVRPASAEPEGTVTVPPGEELEYVVQFKDQPENPEPCPPCEVMDTVKWSFGDGTPTVSGGVPVGTEPEKAYSATARHSYAAEGEHTLTVTISDPTAGSAEFHVKVAVKASLVPTLEAGARFPVPEQPVSFTAEQLASREVTPPLHYEYLVNSQLLEPAEVTGSFPWKASFTHSFAEPGAYHVLVKAHDSSTERKAGSAETLVEVVPPLGGRVRSEPPEAEAGSTYHLIAEPSGGKPPYSYAWTAGGSPLGGSGPEVTAPFGGREGTYGFQVKVSDSASPAHTETLEGQASVLNRTEPLTASISPTGTVKVGETGETTVPFTATVHGGAPPYYYSWKDEWPLEPALPLWERAGAVWERHYDFHVESLSEHTIWLEVDDSRGHIARVSDTVSFEVCSNAATVGLVQIVDLSGHCLKEGTGEEGAKTWSTEDEVRVNGLPIKPARGHPLVLSAPTKAHPGGTIAAAGINLSLAFPGMSITLLHEATLSWDLPSATSGEATLAKLSVSPGTTGKLFGMNVGGSIHVNAGIDPTSQEHYLVFGLNIELPSLFKSGPDHEAGGVTAEGAMRVDLNGYHFDGLHFEIHEAWLGALQVEDLCLAYIPAGSEKPVAECPAPEVEGKPFIECNESVAYSRWSGTAALVLPTASKPKLAIFGGLSNGTLSYFGGILEAKPGLPLVDDVYLDRVGIGMCLQPPPFKLKGEVGVDALPVASKPTLQVNGHFLFEDSYTDESGVYHPWSVELGGSVEVYEQPVGGGHVIVDGNGNLEFGLYAELHLLRIVSVEGRVEGWIEPAERLFNIAGNVRACIWKACGNASGVISSTGVAGCVYTEIGKIRIGAGFGHRWDEGPHVQLLGSSCDFGPFEATHAAVIAAAGAAGRVVIPKGTRAIVLRVGGIGSPPQVTLRGPGGASVTTPSHGAARGRGYWAVTNPTDDSTDILLAGPAGGVWHVAPIPGSARIASITTSRFLGTPSGHARVRRRGRAVRVLRGRLYLPAGERVQLGELAGRGKQAARTLHVGRRLRRCGRRGGELAFCLRFAFRPAPGMAGGRRIVATVFRGGMPVGSFVLARFHAAAPRLPSRPRVRLLRRGSRVIVAWTPAAGARRYTISVRTSTGRKLGFNPPARCRQVVVGGVTRGTQVSAEVAGVRADMAVGRYAHATLRARHRSAGARGHLRGPRCQ